MTNLLDVRIEQAKPHHAALVNGIVARGRAGYARYVAGLDDAWVEDLIRHTTSPEQVEKCAQRIADTLANPDKYLYLVAALGDDAIVGTLHAEKEPSEHPGKEELIRMFVDEDARGQGVGQALMQVHMLWAEADPDLGRMLYVTQGNKDAQRFYNRWDYQIVPGSEHTFDDKIPTVIMEVPLEEVA